MIRPATLLRKEAAICLAGLDKDQGPSPHVATIQTLDELASLYLPQPFADQAQQVALGPGPCNKADELADDGEILGMPCNAEVRFDDGKPINRRLAAGLPERERPHLASLWQQTLQPLVTVLGGLRKQADIEMAVILLGIRIAPLLRKQSYGGIVLIPLGPDKRSSTLCCTECPNIFRPAY